MIWPTPDINDSEFKNWDRIEESITETAGIKDPQQQPDDYAVYVLECEGFDDDSYGTDEHFLNCWRVVLEDDDYSNNDFDPHDPPRWAWAAFYSDRLFYVGQTASLWHRMTQHVDGVSSVFACVFKRYRIEHIEFVKTREQALKREKELAEEYSDRTKGWFSYYA